ncbi:MAG: nitrate reductase cytochrome c-type subunit [Betaproteobacteria bacterium]|nr:nitrate reductase cytochrome c-type subunit [Betaproteobacteria bacterium]
MKKTVSIVLATLVATVIGCATTMAPTPMRGADVTAPDKAPDIKQYAEKTPGVGQVKLIERTFVGQPPMVPHSIEKYVPLTIEENACMECHQTDEIRGQKIPKIGTSHFSKTIKTKAGEPVLEMSRFQCDSCHVPQVDAKPLVETQFIGVTK